MTIPITSITEFEAALKARIDELKLEGAIGEYDAGRQQGKEEGLIVAFELIQQLKQSVEAKRIIVEHGWHYHPDSHTTVTGEMLRKIMDEIIGEKA